MMLSDVCRVHLT